MGYKIVEYENGNFIAKEGNWFKGYKGIGKIDAIVLWSIEKNMQDYCSVNTYEEVLNLINKHKIYTNKVSNKIIKETKV